MKLTSELLLRRHHVTLAVVAAVLLSLCWFALVATFGHFAKNDEIAQLRTSIAGLSDRLSRTIAARPEKEAIGTTASPSQSPSVAQSSELAERHIQSALRQLPARLRSDAVQVEAVRGLPPMVEGGLAATRVSVALTVPVASVFDTINLLEASAPAIVVESVRIASRFGPGSRQDAARIQLALRVYAFAPARR